MLQKIISWMESHSGACSFKEHVGLECPGCGIQRSIIAMLKGEFLESIILFPALLPLFAMFAFLGLHLVFDLKHGALVLKIFYITNTILIISGFVYKLIIH